MSLLSKSQVLEKKRKYLIPCLNTFYDEPIYYVRGELQYVYDENDTKYLDMLAGFSANALGHANPYITDRIKEQLDKIVHSTQVFLNAPIVNLAENLSSILPPTLTKSFFVNSGSEGNETAIMVARNYNKKEGVIYLDKSLHGRTNNTLAITGVNFWRIYDSFPMKAYRAETFYPEDNISYKEQMEKSLKSVEEIINNNPNISCMIAEVIQGNGGVLSPHKDYFKRLIQLLHKNNILLIIDEAQTGYGRTGKMFAFENYDFVPDILMTCKALGNGVPISSVTTTDEIANKFTIPSASTTGGNMLSCASANAVIDYIKEFDIKNNVNNLCKTFDIRLDEIKNNSNCHIKSIRGIGLMKGIEFENDVELNKILEFLKTKNIIAGKCGIGRNVMLIQPPLIITMDNVNYFCNMLELSLQIL